jgi:hypothetical protein
MSEDHKVNIPDMPFEIKMPEKATGGCSILMVGSTRCGKTTALKHILKKYFPKHLGAIFSESSRSPAYQDMKYPLLPLSSAYIPEIVKDSYLINRDLKNYYDFLYVLDDCPLHKNDKQLLKLLTIYRNSNISAVIAVQSPTLLNPTCRSNFNFVCLFHQNTSQQTEAVVKAFLRGVLPQGWNYDHKIDWYERMTRDHHFLFLDNLNGTLYRCKIDMSR